MNARAWSRVLSFLLAVGLAFWFTLENAGERVLVDFILFRMRLSLPVVVFLSVLLGMLIIFLVGLRADLRTRRTLERYRRAVDVRDEPTESDWSGRQGWGRPARSAPSDRSEASDRAEVDRAEVDRAEVDRTEPVDRSSPSWREPPLSEG